MLIAVLYRSQNRPGSPKQAQTWRDGSTYSIVHGTPAFAEIRPIYFGLWCAKNGVLNQFSHSLLIEIPWRDSLLARTDINTQDRQESAVRVVSVVSACHCETVLGQHRLPLQATRTTTATARHSPRGRRCGSGRWAPLDARQEQSACRSSRENCSHKASGQACCQSARAIRTLERADNLLAGARGHATLRNQHEIRTQTNRLLHSMGHCTIRRASQIPSNFIRLRARRFCFMLRLGNESNIR